MFLRSYIKNMLFFTFSCISLHAMKHNIVTIFKQKQNYLHFLGFILGQTEELVCYLQ